MALTAAATLLAASATASWNAIRRDTGWTGVAATAGMVLLAVAVLAPVFGVGALFGAKIAPSLRAPGDATALPVLAAVFAGAALGAGALGGLRARVHFPATLVTVLPLSARAHALAELALGVLEPVILVATAALLGLCAGLVRAQPSLLPAAIVATGSTVLAMLLVQALAGLVLRALRERGDTGPLLLALALGALSWWLFDRIWPWAPTSQLALALVEHARGAWVAGTPRLVLAAGAVAACVIALAGPIARSLRRLPDRRGVGFELGWAIARPAPAVAAVFCAQVWRTRRGRMMLLMPAIVASLVVVSLKILEWDVARGNARELQSVIAGTTRFAWFLWLPPAVALFGAELWLNLFGWDRRGIKGLLALPLAPRDLLLGKWLGLLALFVASLAPALLIFGVLRRPEVAECAGGFAALLAAWAGVGAIGQRLSLRFAVAPNPDTAGGALAAPVALLGTVVALAIGLAIGLAFALGGATVLALLALLAIAGYFLTLTRASVALESATEALVRKLSGS